MIKKNTIVDVDACYDRGMISFFRPLFFFFSPNDGAP